LAKKPAKKKKKQSKFKRVSEDQVKIIELIDQARYENSKTAYDEICNMMKSYVSSLCRKYNISGHSNDDIESECFLALISKAVPDFNPKKGKFKTFAVLCMERHLLSIIKSNDQQKNKTLNRSISIDKTKAHGDGEIVSLKNIIANNDMAVDEQVYNKEEEVMLIKALREVLSPFERDVFDLYIKKYSYEEIVEKLLPRWPDCSARAVDNSCMRTKLKAKKIAKNLDI